ncbi:MAG TPA: gliding motility-associated C-terminal domain-containing protein [Chryseosolibacter sp.]
MHRQILFVFFFLPCAFVHAQSKRTNIGVFGSGTGMDFNFSPPHVFSVPNTGEYRFDSFEGSAAISDFNGNLLFYSNGIHVWDRNHQIMANGYFVNGIPFDSDPNAAQCLIVPIPKDPFRYYLITARMQGQGALTCSLIDIRLRQGLGDVVEKIQIFSPSTEKMAIVKHTSGESLWLISHEYGNNRFRANLITETGIDMQSIISDVGLVHRLDVRGSNAIGYLKPSHDGKLLACTVAGDMGTLEHFKFDASTGIVSEPVLLIDENPEVSYGIEFSPDDSKLYVTQLFGGLYQFDLAASDVVGSKTKIYKRVEAALQLGPDGKIYADGRRSPYFTADTLDVIHNPNAPGEDCKFDKNAFYLGRNYTYSGLPEFVSDVIDPLILHDKFCANQQIEFRLTNLSGFTSINWDFGDEGSQQNTSSEFYPRHTYTKPGTYRIRVAAHYPTGVTIPYEQNVSVLDKPSLELGRDTILCPQQSITLKPIVDNSVTKFIWKDGSNESTKVVNTTGFHRVTVWNEACSTSDSLRLSFMESPTLALKDTAICFNQKLRVDLPGTYDYTWSDGQTGALRLFEAPGQFSVKGMNRCASANGKFKLSIVPRLAVDFGADTILCSGEILTLDATSHDAEYTWSDKSTDPVRVVDAAGDYSVTLSNRCESVSDSIHIRYDNTLEYFIPNIITPNADGLNETFTIDERFGNSELSIFNKWGKKIFSASPYENNWSGEQIDGVYLYALRYRCGLKKGWIQVR